MKACIFSLVVVLAVTYVSSKPKSQNNVKDYQTEILKLYQGIGSEDTHDFVRKDFPFADTKYFTESSVVGKFVAAYEDGFLDKEGYFNLYSYKNRHDTYRLFDLFYFAKDFDTFIKIAKWAKSELNPVQFVHAFTAAVYHRKDTQGTIVPAFYEILPHYFTPTHIMTAANKAMIQDVKYRKFDVNFTGYEYSWYKDQAVDSYKFSQSYNPYDVESRTAYFREDVGLNDWYSKFFLQLAPWLSDEKYPDIKWENRGQAMFTYLSYILARYNLERYSVGLPPVEPIDFKKPIKTGYNPHLFNIQGRPLFPRPDGLIPYVSSPVATEYFYNMYHRYLGEVDSYTMYNPLNHSHFSIDGVEGFETFSKIFFGISHPAIRKYYRPLYYQALETLDSAVRSSNDVGYTGTAVGNFMTEVRDPAFYQILAYLNGLFRAYNAKKTPYTKQDIEFPGVKVSTFEFSKLETFMEKYEYDISNGVPSKGDTDKYKYIVSRPRLNHKPFSYKINIQSDKEVEATVKVFFAPKFDSDFRLYGMSGFNKHVTGFNMFHVKLKPGMNTFEQKPTAPNGYHQETPRIKHIMENINQAEKTGEPLFYTKDVTTSFPTNLALPRGSKEGTYLQVAAVVQPKGNSGSASHQEFKLFQGSDPEQFIFYPFDRPVTEFVMDVPNVHFSEVVIYDITKE